MVTRFTTSVTEKPVGNEAEALLAKKHLAHRVRVHHYSNACNATDDDAGLGDIAHRHVEIGRHDESETAPTWLFGALHRFSIFPRTSPGHFFQVFIFPLMQIRVFYEIRIDVSYEKLIADETHFVIFAKSFFNDSIQAPFLR